MRLKSIKKAVMYNIAVFILYVTSGFLGLMLAVPPGYATPIWACSGIALGAVLVWGLRTLPGIFIASFILNFFITIFNTGNEVNFLNACIGLITGTGAVLQALLGWFLVKRVFRINPLLHHPKDILIFSLITGPVSCIVAATIANLGLCFLGILTTENFALSWLTWWIGDSIGVLIFTPVFLISFAKPRKFWQRRVIPILVPLCLTFIIVIIAHAFYSKSELKRVQSKFTELTQYKLNQLSAELKLLSENARTISLFLATTPIIDKKEFQHQANVLLQKNDMIQSVQWAPKITNKQNKSWSCPILFTTSKNKNIFPDGYDFASNPNLTKLAYIPSEKPIILSNDGRLNQIFIASAVFKEGQFTGFSILQINIMGLLEQAFDNFKYFPNVSLEIDTPGINIHPTFEIHKQKNQSGPQIAYKRDIVGSTWHINATLSPYFINHEYSWDVWFALAATLFFCVSVNIILFILYGQHYLTQFLADAKTVQFKTEKAKNLLLLNAASEGIFWINVHYKITYINAAAEKLLGYTSEELKDEPIIKVMGQNTTLSQEEQILNSTIYQAINNKTIIKINESVFLKKNHEHLWVEYTCIPIIINHQVRGAAVIFSDITERLENEKNLIKLAHYDPLTTLPNRLSFFDYFEHALARAIRNKTSLGVCFIDVDNFKVINDTYGHIYGDKLLMYLPTIITPHLREIDYLARIGGDEFGLIFEDIHNKNDMLKIFDRILTAFNDPIQIDDHRLRTSISIGIALYPQDGLDSQTLFKNADIAMYRAKANGKATFAFYDEIKP